MGSKFSTIIQSNNKDAPDFAKQSGAVDGFVRTKLDLIPTLYAQLLLFTQNQLPQKEYMRIIFMY